MNVQGGKEQRHNTIPCMKKGDSPNVTHSKNIIMQYCEPIYANKFNNLN